jgi:hypothetical protein
LQLLPGLVLESGQKLGPCGFFHPTARPQDVDQQQSKKGCRCRQQQEKPEGQASDPPQPAQVADGGDAQGERGQNQRDHHHEKEPQEDLADRVDQVGQSPLENRLDHRGPAQQRVDGNPRQGAQQKTEQDPVVG